MVRITCPNVLHAISGSHQKTATEGTQKKRNPLKTVAQLKKSPSEGCLKSILRNKKDTSKILKSSLTFCTYTFCNFIWLKTS